MKSVCAEGEEIKRGRNLREEEEEEGEGGGEGSPKPDLVTRDLLGGCCAAGGGAVLSPATKKVPLPDLHALSCGEEKRLPAMDLNLPPLLSLAPSQPVRTTALQTSVPALDLRLRSLAPPPPPPPAEYQSVCTLEKVKSALDRAERETRRRQHEDPAAQPRRTPARSASPTSSSTTTSSAKRRLGGVCGAAEDGEGESGSSPRMEPGVAKGEEGSAADAAAEMAAAGCPSCLMYVLISRSNPRCPRCSSAVALPPPPLQAAGKKPRIDLNCVAAPVTASAAAATSSQIRTVKFF